MVQMGYIIAVESSNTRDGREMETYWTKIGPSHHSIITKKFSPVSWLLIKISQSTDPMNKNYTMIMKCTQSNN